MNIYTYRVIIEPDERNTFHGYVPSLPGCHTWGETLDETRKNLRDAIDVYIRSLIGDNEKIPVDQGIELVETITLQDTKTKSPVYV